MKKIINIQINQDILKIIAILTMTLDHIGYILTPSFEAPLRLIGRLSFPIFVFLMVFNLCQKDLFTKYIQRLLTFAILTSLIIGPFKYTLNNILPLNIFWTLFLGMLTIYGIHETIHDFKDNKTRLILITYIIGIGALISFLTDYEFYGYLYILSMYGYLKTKNKIFGILSLIFGFLINLHISITASLISYLTTFVFLLPLSKSEVVRRFLKPWWIFYAYYPIHLAILYAIKIYY